MLDRTTIDAAILVGSAISVGMWIKHWGVNSGKEVPTCMEPVATSPGRWTAAFLIICGMLLLNQVVFGIQVECFWDGTVSEIAQYFPPLWFQPWGPFESSSPQCELLRSSRLVGAVAEFSVLRVNALLELPFTLLAYLAVMEWGPSEVQKRLNLMIVPAALAFTSVLMVLEVESPNPWTRSDLAMRALSALATPVLALSFARMGEPRIIVSRARPTIAMVLDLAIAALLIGGFAVLMAYLTLVYNLSELGWLWPVVVPLGSAIVVLRRSGPSSATRNPLDDYPLPDHLRLLLWAGSEFGLLFFPVSLAVRYQWPSGISLVAVSILSGLACFSALIRFWRDLTCSSPA